MVSLGLAEARYMPGTGKRRWELFPGPLCCRSPEATSVGCSWHRAHSSTRGFWAVTSFLERCDSVPMLCRDKDD